MKKKLTKLEKETIITYNEAEDSAEVFTFHEPLKNRLATLAAKHPEDIRLFRSYPNGSVEYRIPKSLLRIKSSRIISDEQRARLAAQAKKRFGKRQQFTDSIDGLA